MKTKTLTFESGKYLIVDAPRDGTNYRIESIIGMYRMDYLVYNTPNLKNNSFQLPTHKEFQIVGFLSDLTEEQFAGIVDKATWGGNARLYLSYTNPSSSIKMSAKESFYSKLEVEGVLLENPYGLSQPDGSETGDPIGGVFLRQYWQEAETNVFRNPLLLKNI